MQKNKSLVYLENSKKFKMHMEKNGSFSGKIQKIAMRENGGILGVFSLAYQVKNSTYRACENIHLYIQTLKICEYANMQICECL